MAITSEIIGKWIDGKTDLISRKSDNPDMQLSKVGTSEVYDEAVDLATSPVEYREVPKPITVSSETVSAEQAVSSEPSDGEQGDDSLTPTPTTEVD